MMKEMLNQRQSRFDQLRSEGRERLIELSDVFSGRKPLSRIEKNGTQMSPCGTELWRRWGIG